MTLRASTTPASTQMSLLAKDLVMKSSGLSLPLSPPLTRLALREFLDTFDGAEKDGKVTVQEFCKYYANLSSSIDEDDYFELMMRNAWHISGGEGWCANTSCRRVLVTHTDGTQTVEEIKVTFSLAPSSADLTA
jgi:hypothetical protein